METVEAILHKKHGDPKSKDRSKTKKEMYYDLPNGYDENNPLACIEENNYISQEEAMNLIEEIRKKSIPESLDAILKLKKCGVILSSNFYNDFITSVVKKDLKSAYRCYCIVKSINMELEKDGKHLLTFNEETLIMLFDKSSERGLDDLSITVSLFQDHKYDVRLNKDVYHNLILWYIREGQFGDALSILSLMIDKGVDLGTDTAITLSETCIQNNRIYESINIYLALNVGSIDWQRNLILINYALKACFELQLPEHALAVYALNNNALPANHVAYNYLLKILSKSPKHRHLCEDIMMQMDEILIQDAGHPDKVYDFPPTESKKVDFCPVWNQDTFCSIIESCNSMDRVDYWTERMHRSIMVTVDGYNSIIKKALELEPERVQSILSKMKREQYFKNEGTYEILIKHEIEKGDIDKAIKLYVSMIVLFGVEPTPQSSAAILQLGLEDKLKKKHYKLLKNIEEISDEKYTTPLNIKFSSSGEKLLNILDKYECIPGDCANVIFRYALEKGLYNEIIELYSDLTKRGCVPNTAAFNIVIFSHFQLNNIDKVLEVFTQAFNFRCISNFTKRLVAECCEVSGVVTPIQANEFVNNSLLNLSKSSNLEEKNQEFKEFIEREKQQSGLANLPSNIFLRQKLPILTE